MVNSYTLSHTIVDGINAPGAFKWTISEDTLLLIIYLLTCERVDRVTVTQMPVCHSDQTAASIKVNSRFRFNVIWTNPKLQSYVQSTVPSKLCMCAIAHCWQSLSAQKICDAHKKKAAWIENKKKHITTHPLPLTSIDANRAATALARKHCSGAPQ